MSNDKKVLLRISNLKQWFPLKKRGMYVKANDGIDLEIYEGQIHFWPYYFVGLSAN